MVRNPTALVATELMPTMQDGNGHGLPESCISAGKPVGYSRLRDRPVNAAKDECDHPSSSGADMTHTGNPAKVWHCHQCHKHHRDGVVVGECDGCWWLPKTTEPTMTAPTQPDPLDALLALAEAANQGESWWDRWFAPSDDLRFIAACDPATVVGLIKRVREAEPNDALRDRAAEEAEARAEAAEQRAERETKLRIQLTTLVGETQARADAAEQRVKELEAEAKVDAEYYVTDTESFVTVHARMLAAEAREQALRDRVTELAGRIEGRQSYSGISNWHDCIAHDLRALLSPPTADTQPEDKP